MQLKLNEKFMTRESCSPDAAWLTVGSHIIITQLCKGWLLACRESDRTTPPPPLPPLGDVFCKSNLRDLTSTPSWRWKKCCCSLTVEREIYLFVYLFIYFKTPGCISYFSEMLHSVEIYYFRICFNLKQRIQTCGLNAALTGVGNLRDGRGHNFLLTLAEGHIIAAHPPKCNQTIILKLFVFIKPSYSAVTLHIYMYHSCSLVE